MAFQSTRIVPVRAARPTAARRRRAQFLLLLLFALATALSISPWAHAERVKDIAQVEGVRGNPLVGYGLVVGLDGTGDQTSQAPFTTQSLKTMLERLGVTVPPNVNPQLKNVAAVAIQAELPPFARPGQAIDITVSSIGNAGSLRGGALLMAPLRGADGEVYAIAQGNLVVGGFGARGQDGSRVAVNVQASGRIPNGAIVERPAPPAFTGGPVTLNLHDADFTTAQRVADAINARLGPGTASALDAGSIALDAPSEPTSRTAFLASVESIDVTPGDAPAKVVVNSRTGTVVIGAQVRVSPAAVAHGSITVTVAERPAVSQPAPFGEGETVVVPQSDVQVTEEESRMFLFAGGVSLDEIVRAVNQVGAAPGDVVAILEALKQAGALRAELEII
ncbi:MAG: flagellar basal body P-ring protein FlgI [Xanthomonadaceae bacterium]|jgi:flagellar P-ring protein precursor FlgI|nr:flagellar basal body P-ring protein FlgI [Xanthomonadaceae bacterium]